MNNPNSPIIKTKDGVRILGLTPEKLQILSGLAQGFEVEVIAASLHVKPCTVYAMIRDLKLSMGATTPTHLTALSIGSGFISWDGDVLIDLGETPCRKKLKAS